MLPYSSSARTSKWGGSVSRKLCGCRACWCWLFSPTKSERLHRSWPWHVQPIFIVHFVIFHHTPPPPHPPTPTCQKCLISQIENVSPAGKQLLLKEQMAGLQTAAQRKLLSRIVGKRRIPRCRTGSQRRRESCFPSFSLGSVRDMGHKKCCEINNLVLICMCNFAYKYIRLLFFWIMSFVL